MPRDFKVEKTFRYMLAEFYYAFARKKGKKFHEVKSHQKMGFELPLEGPLHAASFSIDAHKSGKKRKGKVQFAC